MEGAEGGTRIGVKVDRSVNTCLIWRRSVGVIEKRIATLGIQDGETEGRLVRVRN